MEPKGMKPPMAEGMGMPPMMQQMMQKMMEGKGEFNPMAMCQAMMTSVGKAAEMAAYATPEVRILFEEWARSVEDEVLAVLKARGPLDLTTLAVALKIGPESALHFLGRLVREGKATISGIQAATGDEGPGAPSR
jgi:hypothetical protein